MPTTTIVKKDLYDMQSSLYVLSSLMHNPILLEDNGFTFVKTDFDQRPLHSMVFRAIYNLEQNGVNTITPVDIDSYLKQFDTQYAYYQKNNGFTWLNQCYDMIKNDNVFDKAKFKMYYDRVKKFSVLRDLESKGIDTTKYYDPNKDALNKDQEDEKLNKTSVAEILNSVREEVADIEDTHVGKDSRTSQEASVGLEELYQSLKKTPEIGLPLDGDIINYAVRGAREGKMYIYSAPTGMGKALPNSTMIPLANGSWKTVGEVKEGDYLIDRHGKPTKVLKVFPQGVKDVYQITFKDGRKALCNDEHLWTYHNTCSKDNNKLETRTLKELLKDINRLGYKTDRAWRYSIPNNEAITYNTDVQLDLNPYLLGLLIGDGSFRQQKSNRNLTFATNDVELLNSFRENGLEPYRHSLNNYDYSFKDQNNNNVHVKEFCDQYHLELLYNKYGYEKEIPEKYLISSVKDRMSLLQGLLDTGGHVDKKGRVSFSNTSKILIDQVRQLCQSLGLMTTLSKDKRCDKYTNGHCYTVQIIGKPEIKKDLFRLPRQREKLSQWYNNGKRKMYSSYNPIINIENLHRQEEMTCFLVDNDEHLFLMNDFIVTHNTRFMVDQACAISMPYLDSDGNIVCRSDYQKVLFVATEMQAEEIQTLILAHVSGVNEGHITLGQYLPGEEEKIEKAIAIVKQYPNFIIDCIPDPSIATLKARLAKYILHDGIKYIFYDYIFSSPGLLSEFRDVAVREDVALMMLSNTLKEIAMSYGVFVQTATQLNDGWSKKEIGIRDQNMIRGSKAIIDKADCGIIGVKLFEDSPEWKQIEQLWSKMKYKEEFKGISKPNMVLDIYKNRRGSINSVKVFRYFDFGTCRCRDLFITDANYKMLDQEIQKITYETHRYTSLDLMLQGEGKR